MIRRELGIDPYKPTDPEVERVKEEFGLFRGNLQYRPSPAEIEEIVRACPIMINGESTERIEVRAMGVCATSTTPASAVACCWSSARACLKAPKIQRHTERLKVPGWDFISKFASKGKEKEEGSRRASIPQGRSHFQIHERHHRRPSGLRSSLEAGGFRLRYGRARPLAGPPPAPTPRAWPPWTTSSPWDADENRAPRKGLRHHAVRRKRWSVIILRNGTPPWTT